MGNASQDGSERGSVPVVPRVRAGGAGDPFPIDYFMRELVGRQWRGRVNVYGPVGSGKSVALCYLAEMFGERIRVVDGETLTEEMLRHEPILVFTSIGRDPAARASFEMEPWGQDEVIEYLLHTHRDQCKSVMARLQGKGVELEGIPELWAGVLEEFAADESLTDISEALRRIARRDIVDPVQQERAGRVCLEAIISTAAYWANIYTAYHVPRRWLRHRPVGLVVASDFLAGELQHQQWNSHYTMLPWNLIERTALTLRGQTEATASLEAAVEAASLRQPAGISLLVAMNASWRPRSADEKNLNKALLRGARWGGIDLTRANLNYVDFSQADLSEATLAGSKAEAAIFRQANLRSANLNAMNARGANFTLADLSHAYGHIILFTAANLSRARLVAASFPMSNFHGADLRGCDLSGANLHATRFNIRSRLEGTDFSGADLSKSEFQRARLRETILKDASFQGATFAYCDMEGLELPDAHFEDADLMGSYLTGSVIRGGHFHGADLQRTGLADVNWEKSDLRDADFTEASFHLGSSRSGLVDSTIASEGTRTGFYTDDYDDKYYKAPEEIRKANFRGCDLTGAKVDGADWYLVDLRDAIYSDEQRLHFARCGAILNVQV